MMAIQNVIKCTLKPTGILVEADMPIPLKIVVRCGGGRVVTRLVACGVVVTLIVLVRVDLTDTYLAYISHIWRENVTILSPNELVSS
jgi:hypothetical protein